MGTLFPCPSFQPCDADNPLSNLSAELPDQEVFTAVFFPNPFQQQPPLNQTYVAQGCVSVCTSTISQEDANLCAARQATQCNNNQNPCPIPPCPPPPPPEKPCVDQPACPLCSCPTPTPCFPPCSVPPPPGGGSACNTPQNCCAICPDGTSFCFTVPACTFVGKTVAEANAIAHSYACKQAGIFLLCIAGSPPSACAGQSYSGVLFATGGVFQNFNWTIVSGSLPPGLTGQATADTSSFVISGTPTQAGNFTFTVRVDDVSEKGSSGAFSQKTFTIGVMAITSGAPPDGQVGQPYSYQMVVEGGIAPLNFFAQSLPPGLELTSDGLVTGTPTDEGDFIIELCVQDSSGNEPCCTTVLFHITGQFENTEQKYGCPDLHGPTVHGSPFFTVAAGTFTSSISQEDADNKAKAQAQAEFFDYIFGGGQVNCCNEGTYPLSTMNWSQGCSAGACDSCSPTLDPPNASGTWNLSTTWFGGTTGCSSTQQAMSCNPCTTGYTITCTITYNATFTDTTPPIGGDAITVFYPFEMGTIVGQKILPQHNGNQSGTFSFTFDLIPGLMGTISIEPAITINGGVSNFSGTWKFEPLTLPCEIY